MSMSEHVLAEYNDAMRTAVLHHGELINTNPDIYSWRDYSLQSHLRTCVLTCVDVPKSDKWNEFAGTSFDGDTRHFGIVVTGVSCECGKIRNRMVRWEETISCIAEAVFSIAAEKWFTDHN